MTRSPTAQNLRSLNELLHVKTRLGIMTLITRWSEADFSSLKKTLALTDGNLGRHLRTLEEAGYLEVEKGFVNRKSRTLWRITPLGRQAFHDYLTALSEVISDAEEA